MGTNPQGTDAEQRQWPGSCGGRQLIRGSADLRDAYRDETVARSYIERRFREPLGALLHGRQVDVVKEAIRRIGPRQVLEIAPGPARLTAEIAPGLTIGSLTLADASAQMLAEATPPSA